MATQILDYKTTKAKIGAFARSAAKQDAHIHLLAMSALSHYAGQGAGDATLITDLCKAMPKSSRGNALKYWVTTHANVQWNAKAYAGEGGFTKKKADEKALFDFDKADAAPFYEKADTERSEYVDPIKLAFAALARIKKALADNKVSEEHIGEAQEIVAAIEGLNLKPAAKAA